MAAGGSGEIRTELARARGTGKVHGAYLFEGPPGSDKVDTALWFAQLLLCKAAPANALDPCGQCHDCRLFATDAHPDFHRAELDGAWIKVDAVRELRARLGLVANERGRRVGFIPDAEKLRAEAANALLKTLEEPPPDTVLLLVTSAIEALPRTLRSRAIRVRFPRLPEREIAAALEAEGMPALDAALASQLGGASTEAARAWAEHSLGEARDILEVLERSDSLSVSDVLDFAEGFRRTGEEGRTQARAYLDVHSAFARTQAEAAAQAGDARALERWLRAFESASNARLELERRNLNPQLLVESLLLELRS
jgi:DNA polymerase III subunit delta'